MGLDDLFLAARPERGPGPSEGSDEKVVDLVEGIKAAYGKAAQEYAIGRVIGNEDESPAPEKGSEAFTYLSSQLSALAYARGENGEAEVLGSLKRVATNPKKS